MATLVVSLALVYESVRRWTSPTAFRHYSKPQRVHRLPRRSKFRSARRSERPKSVSRNSWCVRSMHPPSVWSWTKLHEVCLASRHLRSLEAARRSRVCAYLADDDHGPLALQEILLAGCLPDVSVRNRVMTCGLWRSSWRPLNKPWRWIAALCGIGAAKQFDTDRIVDSIINAVNTVRLGGGIATAASV